MKLNAQLKEDTGYSWVMARMEPASPFGHALVRSPHWYGPGEEEELEAEFSRVEQLREEILSCLQCGYEVVDPEKCIACGMCQKLCPKGDVITMEAKGGNAR